MSTVKTKFTLHENYKDFALGVSKIDQNTLIPYSSQDNIGCLVLFSILAAIFLVFMVAAFTSEAIFPILSPYFSHQTTAQITDCEIFKTDKTRTIHLTYQYKWNGKVIEGWDSVRYFNPNDCSDYLNQMYTISVFVPDPSKTRLPIAYNSVPPIERIGSAIAFFVMAFLAFGGLHQFLRNIILQLYSKARYRRLLRQSILLEGEIIRIHSYKPGKTDDYVISLTYAFETPHKRRLTGWAEARRDDLRDTPLPPIGTPIAVLYADDHAHMML